MQGDTHLRRLSRFVGPALVTLAVVPGPVRADEPPLPDPEVFAEEVRKRLRSNRALQNDYTYTETRIRRQIGADGRVQSETVEVYEVYPGLEIDDPYRRRISVDGEPVDPTTLERDDRRYREQIIEGISRRERETPAERVRREQREAELARDQLEELEDLFRVFELRMTGREPIDGHRTIVVSLEPRERARPRTRAGRIVQHFRGHAWISEDEYELVRVDVEAVETVTLGWIAFRLHEGARAFFTRTKTADGTWLPAESRLSGSGRILLFRTFREDRITRYSNYRRVHVEGGADLGWLP